MVRVVPDQDFSLYDLSHFQLFKTLVTDKKETKLK